VEAAVVVDVDAEDAVVELSGDMDGSLGCVVVVVELPVVAVVVVVEVVVVVLLDAAVVVLVVEVFSSAPGQVCGQNP